MPPFFIVVTQWLNFFPIFSVYSFFLFIYNLSQIFPAQDELVKNKH